MREKKYLVCMKCGNIDKFYHRWIRHFSTDTSIYMEVLSGDGKVIEEAKQLVVPLQEFYEYECCKCGGDFVWRRNDKKEWQYMRICHTKQNGRWSQDILPEYRRNQKLWKQFTMEQI